MARSPITVRQWALAAAMLLAMAPVLCSGGSRGMQLVQAGRLEEAVEAFAEQARASGAAHDFYNMALAAAQLGRADQVADALVEAIFAQPSFADAWINFGVFFQQREEISLAMRCYRTAARIAAGHTRALALYNMGAMHLRADEVQQAHAAYVAAREANPLLAVATDGLGAIAMRLGKLKVYAYTCVNMYMYIDGQAYIHIHIHIS